MSHAIGSHLLRMRSRAVGQTTTMSGTMMMMNNEFLIAPCYIIFGLIVDPS